MTDRQREINCEPSPRASDNRECVNPAFGAYAAAWLMQREVASRTREHYRRLLDTRLLPTFADTDLRTISPTAVREWYVMPQIKMPAKISQCLT
uniref:Prophage phiRv2 integrase n=1 Tax=Mycobacterium riyadhense TaxID=486698 RepID=A0A653EWS6_9MYCO|nr:Putative prophage phiRv2 integrase [Mycobacterium riyadhense]